MPTYDEAGNFVPDDSPEPPPASVGSERTFGAAVYAFFHPETVQREYAATGQTVPDQMDIMMGAADDMETHAAAAVDLGAQQFARAAKVVAAGVVVLAGLYIYRELSRGR